MTAQSTKLTPARWPCANRSRSPEWPVTFAGIRSSGKIIHIYTDSAYARNGCITWRHNWKKNGWVKSDKKPVENLDLWKQLDELLEQHEVKLFKVKGHSGHPQNDLADSMAVAAARGQVFKGYRQVGDYQFDWREVA